MISFFVFAVVIGDLYYITLVLVVCQYMYIKYLIICDRYMIMSYYTVFDYVPNPMIYCSLILN